MSDLQLVNKEHDKLSSTDSGPDLSQAEHRRILRKLDWNLLPLVSVLYLFSFLYACPF